MMNWHEANSVTSGYSRLRKTGNESLRKCRDVHSDHVHRADHHVLVASMTATSTPSQRATSSGAVPRRSCRIAKVCRSLKVPPSLPSRPASASSCLVAA